MSETSFDVKKIKSSGLEKSIEFRYFMIFTCFILYLDSIWMLKGTGGFDNAGEVIQLSSPFILEGVLILGGFYFLIALVFPVLRKLLLLILLYAEQLLKLTPKVSNTGNSDETYLSIVKAKALREKDSFWLSEVEKREQAIEEREINLNLNLSMLVFFIINYFVINDEKFSSLTRSAEALLDKDFGIFISVLINFSFVIFIGFLFFATLASLSTRIEDKIYYPEQVKEYKSKEDFNISLNSTGE
jgi:hypothetical protein